MKKDGENNEIIEGIKTEISGKPNMNVETEVVIGKKEANRLLRKKEYPAALLITAVDLEYILKENLKHYYKENKDSIYDNGVKGFLGDLVGGDSNSTLGTCIKKIEEIYNNSDCSEFNRLPEVDWKKNKGAFDKLKEVRNDIAHERGTYRKLQNDEYNCFNSKEDVEDLIDSVYDFCQEHPA